MRQTTVLPNGLDPVLRGKVGFQLPLGVAGEGARQLGLAGLGVFQIPQAHARHLGLVAGQADLLQLGDHFFNDFGFIKFDAVVSGAGQTFPKLLKGFQGHQVFTAGITLNLWFARFVVPHGRCFFVAQPIGFVNLLLIAFRKLLVTQVGDHREQVDLLIDRCVLGVVHALAVLVHADA